MKKIVKLTNVVILIAVMILFTNTYSFAKKWVYKDMKDAFLADKNIVNTLSKKELKEWKEEANAAYKMYMQKAGETISATQKMYYEEADTAQKILTAIKDVERKENSKDQVEDNKDMTEEEKKERDEKLKKYDIVQITEWLLENDPKSLSKDVKDKWRETIDNDTEQSEEYREQARLLLEGKSLSETNQKLDPTISPIYKYPSKTNTTVSNSEQSLEDMMSDANDFINKGAVNIDQGTLSNFSKTMYNILLAVGVVVAVIIGAIIGLKLMTSSIEEKAEAKKLLVPYVVGCVMVFGGFAIWKLVVTILQSI